MFPLKTLSFAKITTMKSCLVFFAVFGVAFGASLKGLEQMHGDYLPVSLDSAEFFKQLQHYVDTRSMDQTRLTAQANDYLDKLLVALGKYMIANGIEPLTLSDVGYEFSWSIIEGEFMFRDGNLRQLYTIRRNGDCTIKYINKLFTIRVPITFEELVFEYSYVAKLIGIGPSGGVKGTVKQSTVYIDMLFDLEFMEIVLQDFKVEDVKDLSLKWTGNALTDWLVNVFTSVTLTFFQGIIVRVLSIFVKTGVEDMIEKINVDLANIFG